MEITLFKCGVVVSAKSTKSLNHQPDEGVLGVTMAYVVLITLMVVCPIVRLVSISMKASEKRR